MIDARSVGDGVVWCGGAMAAWRGSVLAVGLSVVGDPCDGQRFLTLLFVFYYYTAIPSYYTASFSFWA